MPKTKWSANAWKSLQAGAALLKSAKEGEILATDSPSSSTSAMEDMGPDGQLTDPLNPSSTTSASSTGMPSDESMVWKMPMVSALELSLEEFETLPLEELGDSLSPLLILAEGRSEEPHVTIWCAAQAMCEVESDFMEAPLIDGIQWFLANGNC
jgi:hypothetical protein